MLKLLKSSPDSKPLTHEEIFVQHYHRMLDWAMRLTNHDRQRAEDLVQDAFVQFTFARPDLNTIRNLEGYLYGMLRNLHLLDLRRATRGQVRSLSMIDFDSAEIGLRSGDMRMQIQVQEELHRICHYACQRRNSSKAGSVLLLRFFHGYFPNEIALVLRTSRSAVSEFLKLARNEAKLYLENPSAISFIAEPIPDVTAVSFSQDSDKFVHQLNQTIFCAPASGCLRPNDLKNLYHKEQDNPIDAKTLAHFVSCSACLDTINSLLGLPLLAERSPVDSIGPDTKPRGGSGKSGGGASGSGPREVLAKLRRRARQVFEHKPHKLCISVNGDIQIWQTISSTVSEQTVSLEENQRIELIDVTSEQGIRLLYLSVDHTVSGPVEQSLVVALSDHRTLQVSLDCAEVRPQLRVAYHDPCFLSDAGVEPLTDDTEIAGSLTEPQTNDSNRLRKFADWRFWLRPGVVTTVIAIILVGVIAAMLVIYRSPSTTVSSAILSRAIDTESSFVLPRDQALHRTINLEERGPSGELIRQQRIEAWEASLADNGGYVRVRRIFDQNNHLIAGEWIKADGSEFIYNQGAGLTEDHNRQQSLSTLLDTDSAWRLNLAAKDFDVIAKSLLAKPVEDEASSYVLNYQMASPSPDNSSGFRLIKASLTVNKNDLRAVGMTIQVEPRGVDKSIKYVFSESHIERRSVSDTPHDVFEPEPYLRRSDNATGTNRTEQFSRAQQPATDASVIAATELEILGKLDEINALSGDQVNMNRSPNGLLQIEGIVETNQRKIEFLHALASFKHLPFVKIDIQTAEEASRRRARNSTEAISTDNVEIDRSSILVDSDLRTYFAHSRELSGSSLDQEVHRFAETILEQSRQTRRQALALKQIAGQFSSEDLRSLDQNSHSKWRGMLRVQATRLQQDLNKLRLSLRPIFSIDDGGEQSTVGDIGNDNDAVDACNRLFNLVLSTDETIGRSFSIYADNVKVSSVKSKEFWSALDRAEKLASKLAEGQ